MNTQISRLISLWKEYDENNPNSGVKERYMNFIFSTMFFIKRQKQQINLGFVQIGDSYNADVLILDYSKSFFNEKNKKEIDSIIEDSKTPTGTRSVYQTISPYNEEKLETLMKNETEKNLFRELLIVLVFRLVKILKPKIIAILNSTLFEILTTNNNIENFNILLDKFNYSYILSFEGQKTIVKKIMHPYSKNNSKEKFEQSIKYLMKCITLTPIVKKNNQKKDLKKKDIQKNNLDRFIKKMKAESE